MTVKAVYAIVVEGCGAWYAESANVNRTLADNFDALAAGTHPNERLQAFYNAVEPETVTSRVLCYLDLKIDRAAKVTDYVVADEFAFNRFMPPSVFHPRLPGYEGSIVILSHIRDNLHLVTLAGEPLTILDFEIPLLPGDHRFIVNMTGRLFPA